jgi:hypothetical protein
MRRQDILVWWLRQCCASEALIGDFLEEDRARQSGFWLLRQLFLTAVVQSVRMVRDHTWSTVSGVVLGWCLLWIFSTIRVPLVKLDDWLFVRGLADVRAWWPGGLMLFAAVACGGGVAIGFTLRRFFTFPVIVLFVATHISWHLIWLPWVLRSVSSTAESFGRIVVLSYLLQSVEIYAVVPASILIGALARSRAVRLPDGRAT